MKNSLDKRFWVLSTIMSNHDELTIQGFDTLLEVDREVESLKGDKGVGDIAALDRYNSRVEIHGASLCDRVYQELNRESEGWREIDTLRE